MCVQQIRRHCSSLYQLLFRLYTYLFSLYEKREVIEKQLTCDITSECCFFFFSYSVSTSECFFQLNSNCKVLTNKRYRAQLGPPVTLFTWFSSMCMRTHKGMPWEKTDEVRGVRPGFMRLTPMSAESRKTWHLEEHFREGFWCKSSILFLAQGPHSIELCQCHDPGIVHGGNITHSNGTDPLPVLLGAPVFFL